MSELKIDSVYRTRTLGIGLTGIPDQYADGKAARVWQHYIGGHKKRTDQYRDFFCKLLRDSGVKTVWDVACGSGVDSVMLLEHGFNVTSTDASDKMLKHAWKIRWARRKETAFDNWVIEEGNWLALNDADIEVPGEGFDAVICLGNSFAHLPDFNGDLANQKLAVSNFRDALKPGGWLFIDHRNYDAILDTGKAPQRNVYYDSDCILDIKTSVLHVDGRPTMITLDYTVDATQAAKDFVEEGSESSRKRKKSDVGEHDISKFRLSYCPHRLKNFQNMLKEVFGEQATIETFADFQSAAEVENPAYYVHRIQKPLGENGDKA